LGGTLDTTQEKKKKKIVATYVFFNIAFYPPNKRLPLLKYLTHSDLKDDEKIFPRIPYREVGVDFTIRCNWVLLKAALATRILVIQILDFQVFVIEVIIEVIIVKSICNPPPIVDAVDDKCDVGSIYAMDFLRFG